MSRSRKKYAVCGFTCKESEKKDKQKANRRFRRLTKECLYNGKIDRLPYRMREIVNIWDFRKDGKQKIFLSGNKELIEIVKRK